MELQPAGWFTGLSLPEDEDGTVGNALKENSVGDKLLTGAGE
jgi:hypothetical protein